MERYGKTSSRSRGIRGGEAGKRPADFRARALLPTVRKLKARGFISQRTLADELNRMGIPAPRGGRWYQITVARLLTRLGLITVGEGRTNNRLAVKQAADARAKALASTIRKLRKAGFVSISAIARELNERQVPPTWGSKWHRRHRSQTAAAPGKAGALVDIAARAVFLPVESN
jgi:hypothetical protein